MEASERVAETAPPDPNDSDEAREPAGVTDPETVKEQVVEALRNVHDPELGINIVDLGLVYNVEINNETGLVGVTMTLTSMGCPLVGEVVSEVEMRVEQVENVKSCKVEMTFDPPWSPDKMTEDAKWELGMV